jgi:CxxC motif-containing protein
MKPAKAKEIVCIVCPNGCRINCTPSNGGYVFSGNKCPRGIEYAKSELTHPMRSLTTSVRTDFADVPVVSVRTDGEIEKSKMREVVATLGAVKVKQRIKTGDVVVRNVCQTGVDVICTTNRLVESSRRQTAKGAS